MITIITVGDYSDKCYYFINDFPAGLSPERLCKAMHTYGPRSVNFVGAMSGEALLGLQTSTTAEAVYAAFEYHLERLPEALAALTPEDLAALRGVLPNDPREINPGYFIDEDDVLEWRKAFPEE